MTKYDKIRENKLFNKKREFTMLSFLFKKQKKEDKECELDRFVDEHKYLVELYDEILNLAHNKKFKTLKEKSKEFEESLLQHINDEREAIYDKLHKTLTKNNDSVLLKEIEQIKKDIIPLKKKINVINLKFRELNEKNIQDFIYAFSYLKDVLLKRIEVEEKKLFMYFEKKTKR